VAVGPAGEACGQAFPILADYIFRKDKGERKLVMTAPVTQTAAPCGFVVQFVLPKGVTGGQCTRTTGCALQRAAHALVVRFIKTVT